MRRAFAAHGPGATAGARLLLCVPVPVQGLHVHTPPEARAGQTLAFPLPSPFAPTNADGAYSASAMLATDLALAREQRAVSGGGGSNGKRRIGNVNGNSDAPEDEGGFAPGGAHWCGAVAGTEGLVFGGSGPSSAPPSPAIKRARRPQMDELLRSAQNEALHTLRNFKSLADRMGGAPVGAAERRGAVDLPALHRLRCLPEVLATWALCEVVRGRIGMRLITLPQLESMLCSDLPTTAPLAGQPSPPPTRSGRRAATPGRPRRLGEQSPRRAEHANLHAREHDPLKHAEMHVHVLHLAHHHKHRVQQAPTEKGNNIVHDI